MIAAGQVQGPNAGGTPNPPSTRGTSGLPPNIASLLCYICSPITGIIFLLIEKENKDVQFHAWQSTALGVGYIVVLIALEVLAAVMGMIASVLGVIIGFFVPILSLTFIVVWIVCMIKAYQLERWRIPVVGDFAAKKVGI